MRYHTLAKNPRRTLPFIRGSNHSLAVQSLTSSRMNAGVWNTNNHKHDTDMASEEKAPLFHSSHNLQLME